jgi:DNA-binding NarL/FixJ family response regulator
MNPTLIRILVVDDQPLMRDGIASLLARQADLRVIGQASHGMEAVEQAQALQPDVILMDIRMPLMDGIHATQAILKSQPQAKVLMLTTFDDDEYIVASLRAGAVGYILKDIASEELAEAVRLAQKGIFHFDERAGRKLASLLKDKTVTRPNTPMAFERLTEREREVLLLVARGYSNQEIADNLSISEGTVKNHISSILGQLQVRDRIQLIIYAYEHGLVK